MRTHTRSVHTVVLDDDTELELPLNRSYIMDYKDMLLHRTDDKIGIGYLADDEWDQGYYFDEYDEGEFYNLGHSRYLPHTTAVDDPQEFFDELEKKNPGRVFWVDLYDHSLVRYSLAGEGYRCRWDSSIGLFIYVAPSDCPDPHGYASRTMETYTDWCNGSIYSTVFAWYTKHVDEDGEVTWELDDYHTCGGYIGSDYTYEGLSNEWDYYKGKIDGNSV